jgi:AraC-like DNA-binding protein
MHCNLENYNFFSVDTIAEKSLCLIDLGLEKRNSESYYYDNASRDYQGYLFQYTLDGYGIYERQGRQYKLSSGKAFFITFPEDSKYYFPFQDHPDHEWTYFYLHFSGPAVEPFFRRIMEVSGPIMELEINSLPIRLFFELFDTLHSQQQLERYAGSEWLYRFMIALLRSVEFPPTRKLSPHVAAAMEWIKKNYANQVNLEGMSREIGVSYPHLTRQFCKDQGITPIQFLTHIRLQHGMQLLLKSNLSIEKIAEDCGFSCANYFTKVFKKVFHSTPGEYRKLHKHD